MKKITLSLTIILLLLPILTACSSKSSDTDEKVRIVAKPKDGQASEAAKQDEVSTDDSAKPEKAPETDKPSEEGGYEYLNEFIDLICSYSDPPDLEGNELDEYFKEQYDSWESGDGFNNISKDEHGKPVIVDSKDKLLGTWEDSWSQRAHMEITAYDDSGYYQVDIYWGSSAWETRHWSFYGYYDPKEDAIIYEGSCADEITDDDGNTEYDQQYDDGTGKLKLTGSGEIKWIDDKDNAGEDCVFVRAQ